MQTIACFGDSLIYGFPYGQRASWVQQVEQLTEIKMLNYGVCGECTDDIMYRAKTMYLPTQINAYLFWGGANDLLQGRPQSIIMGDLRKMQELAKQKGLPLCFVLPLLSADEYFNNGIDFLRKRMQAEFAAEELLDLQPAIGESDVDLHAAYFDGIHPTAETYKRLGTYAAPLIAAWLKKSLQC